MQNTSENKGMPNMILSCNLMGGESYALVNNVDEYYNRLETLLDDIKQGKGDACDYLYFAFVSLASATLEYSLNFMLAVHCFEKYHYPKYEKHLQPLIKIEFAPKIEITPEIVSDGKFTIRSNNQTLQYLKELVNKRNSIMHNSKAVKVRKFDFPDTGAKIIDEGVAIPMGALKYDGTLSFSLETEDNAISSLTSKWCLRMGTAILNYRECVVAPYLENLELEENDLMKPFK